MFVEFTVPGEPVAKGRARAFIRCGKIGHYTPDKTANYESLVKLFASRAMGNEPLMTKAVVLTVHAFFSIPGSWSMKKQEDAEVLKIRKISRPDLSNVVKGVEDALNGVVWVDDSQIIELHSFKHYSYTPYIRIRVAQEVLL